MIKIAQWLITNKRGVVDSFHQIALSIPFVLLDYYVAGLNVTDALEARVIYTASQVALGVIMGLIFTFLRRKGWKENAAEGVATLLIKGCTYGIILWSQGAPIGNVWKTLGVFAVMMVVMIPISSWTRQALRYVLNTYEESNRFFHPTIRIPKYDIQGFLYVVLAYLDSEVRAIVRIWVGMTFAVMVSITIILTSASSHAAWLSLAFAIHTAIICIDLLKD